MWYTRKRAWLALLGLAACCGSPAPRTEGAGAYFAPGSLCPEYAEVDDLMRGVAEHALAAMGEPSLLARCARGERTCRFLWLGSFAGPIVVRLEPAPGGLSCTATVMDGDLESTEDGAFDVGAVAIRRELTLRAGWSELAARMDAADLWTAPPYSEDEIFTLDGASWLVEVCDGRRRRVVVRNSPAADGPFRAYRELCLWLLRCAEIELPSPKGLVHRRGASTKISSR